MFPHKENHRVGKSVMTKNDENNGPTPVVGNDKPSPEEYLSRQMDAGASVDSSEALPATTAPAKDETRIATRTGGRRRSSSRQTRTASFADKSDGDMEFGESKEVVQARPNLTSRADNDDQVVTEAMQSQSPPAKARCTKTDDLASDGKGNVAEAAKISEEVDEEEVPSKNIGRRSGRGATQATKHLSMSMLDVVKRTKFRAAEETTGERRCKPGCEPATRCCKARVHNKAR